MILVALFGGPGRARRTYGNVRESGDALSFAVLDDREVGGFQIRYLIPLFIGHDDVDLHELVCDLNDILLIRILRERKCGKDDNIKKRQENSLFHFSVN